MVGNAPVNRPAGLSACFAATAANGSGTLRAVALPMAVLLGFKLVQLANLLVLYEIVSAVTNLSAGRGAVRVACDAVLRPADRPANLSVGVTLCPAIAAGQIGVSGIGGWAAKVARANIQGLICSATSHRRRTARVRQSRLCGQGYHPRNRGSGDRQGPRPQVNRANPR